MGLCLQWSVCFPSRPSVKLVIQSAVFLVSTGMAMFDVYTDWVVVLNFQEVGFNNPLLPKSLSVHWLRAWFFFVVIGTVLGVISMFQDTLSLLYSAFKLCTHYCKPMRSSGQPNELHNLPGENRLEEKLLPEDEKEEQEKEEDDEIHDPCLPCYCCGLLVRRL